MTTAPSTALVAATFSVWGLPAVAGLAVYAGLIDTPVACLAALLGTLGLTLIAVLSDEPGEPVIVPAR